ncbi:hypothetical protein DPMN_112576 [Dreissena polymorpha]|nr:hypothetical protein DPMN_112576 [Dreissena polymorpha]
MFDLTELKSGRYNIIYSHPEALHTKKIQKIFHSPVYQQRVCAVAIDEVHMISEW